MSIVSYDGEAIIGHIFPTKFISKWDTTQPGSANDTIVLPLVADGTYDFYIDWGDGSRDTITGYNQSEVTHQYSDTGIYTIQLVANDMVGWQFNDSGDDDKLVEIMDWGPLRFVSDDTNLFKGCSNLTLSTTSNPPFNADAAGMFQDCPSLTGTGGDILNWDVSSVTGMDFMLAGCTNLDPDLSNWNVSAIENAEGFMSGAGLSTMNYDRILSGWSLQAVQSGVTISFGDTKYSEASGEVFRNLLTSAETGWNISDGGMIPLPVPHFISTWDTRNLHQQNGSGPDDKIILPLHSMGNYDFYVDWGDGTPKQHVNNYNSWNGAHTYSVPGIYQITITGTLSGWGYTNFQAAGSHSSGQLRSEFQNDPYLEDQQKPKLISIQDWEALYFLPAAALQFYNHNNLTYFPATIFNVPDNGNLKLCFAHCTGLSVPFGPGGTGDLSNWDTSKVTDMSSMFAYLSTSLLNFNIGSWDTSNVTRMSQMFVSTSNWNNGGSPSISGWDTSKVTRFDKMFFLCDRFNQPIGSWDTSSADNMYAMFRLALDFNQDLSNWDTSNVYYMNFMFDRATSFDQNLGNWNVTSVGQANGFLYNVTLSTSNYNNTLIGWSPQNVQNGVSIDFGNSTYSAGSAASARSTLVSKGWTITDGGQA